MKNLFKSLNVIFTISRIFFNFSIYLIIKNVKKIESKYFADNIISNIKNGGNVYWKLSQWVTSRIELQYKLENNYLVNQLKYFYEKCPAHDFEYSKKVIENYFKKNIDEIFYDINQNADASGSIGQVHIGTLIENNRKVVVKIRHPDITENIIVLCSIIKCFINFLGKLNYLKKTINFDLEGIDKYILDQTDFTHEVKNLNIMKDNFRDVSYIIIPEVYYFNEEMIIMEYVEGDCINKIHSLDTKKHNEMMIKFWLFIRESILINNFFHADLHKGNWKVNQDKIVIYDFGLVLRDNDILEINKLILLGIECRSYELVADVICSNIVSSEKEPDILRVELEDYLKKNLDKNILDVSNDIRMILNFLNMNQLVLKFRIFTYLLAFNLASTNFKNFTFMENNKSYFESCLDRYSLLKDRCKKYGNELLYDRIEIDKELFLELNRDELIRINKEKEDKLKEIDNILDELSSDEEN